MEKLNILYILDGFPRISETFIINEIAGFIERGFEVKILSIRDTRWQKVKNDLLDKYDILNKTIYIKSKKSVINFAKSDLKTLTKTLELCYFERANVRKYFKRTALRRRTFNQFVQIASIIDQNIPDIIYCHFGHVGELFIYLKILFKVPLLTYFHGFDFSRLPRESIVDYTLLFKQGSCFFANSNYTKSKIIELGCPSDKATVIGLPIDTSRFKCVKRSRGNIIRILTVARLTEKKGLQYSILAVSKLLDEYPQIEYNIIGEGEQRSELETLIANLQIQNNVKLLGSKTQLEVIEQMHDSQIFVLSSITAESGDTEGLGLVLLEAQLTGMPVIATLHNGFVDAVNDRKSGFLVPEKDVDSLADKLRYLIENPDICAKLGMEGRKHVIKNYHCDYVFDKIVLMINRLVKKEF
ncbi:MAG: glycosyltransferase [Bacteroidales bacterium]|nr:glycosyltransferase [Bacteroidales bacterium]